MKYNLKGKSGKHRSQQIQKIKRKAKRSSKQPPKLFIENEKK